MTGLQRAKSATIFDVAKLAGVSHQTVSRVLNERPNVRESTQQRVEDAITQLRYRPFAAARVLVTRRSRTVGLVTTGAADFGPGSTVIRFNEAARRAHYAVSMASVLDGDAGSVHAAVTMLLAQNVEAIVVITARRTLLELMRGIDLRIPLIAVDSTSMAGHYSVSINQYQGACNAVEYLISLGHSEILHLAGPEDSMDAAERERGWRQTLTQHKLIAQQPMRGDWTSASGYHCGLTLESPLSFSAIFVANDQMSLGLIHALATHGVRVPEDLSVIGFDDIPEAAHFSPPLTTMRQNFKALGEDVMATLLRVLEGTDVTEAARSVPELVVRSSTSVPGH